MAMWGWRRWYETTNPHTLRRTLDCIYAVVVFLLPASLFPSSLFPVSFFLLPCFRVSFIPCDDVADACVQGREDGRLRGARRDRRHTRVPEARRGRAQGRAPQARGGRADALRGLPRDEGAQGGEAACDVRNTHTPRVASRVAVTSWSSRDRLSSRGGHARVLSRARSHRDASRGGDSSTGMSSRRTGRRPPSSARASCARSRARPRGRARGGSSSRTSSTRSSSVVVTRRHP